MVKLRKKKHKLNLGFLMAQNNMAKSKAETSEKLLGVL